MKNGSKVVLPINIRKKTARSLRSSGWISPLSLQIMTVDWLSPVPMRFTSGTTGASLLPRISKCRMLTIRHSWIWFVPQAATMPSATSSYRLTFATLGLASRMEDSSFRRMPKAMATTIWVWNSTTINHGATPAIAPTITGVMPTRMQARHLLTTRRRWQTSLIRWWIPGATKDWVS